MARSAIVLLLEGLRLHFETKTRIGAVGYFDRGTPGKDQLEWFYDSRYRHLSLRVGWQSEPHVRIHNVTTNEEAEELLLDLCLQEDIIVDWLEHPDVEVTAEATTLRASLTFGSGEDS